MNPTEPHLTRWPKAAAPVPGAVVRPRSSRWPLFLAMGVALFFHTWAAWRSPVWYDDACHWLVARTVAEHGYTAFPEDSHAPPNRASAFATVGPAVNYPVAGWLLLTSDFSLQNARIPMALLALLSLLGVYVLARELTSAPKAAWAILLLAATPQWSVYGAQLLGEVPMLGALCLGLWGLVRLLWQRGSLPWNGLLAWVGFSVAVLCKAYVLLPIGLVLLCVCAWAVVQRRQLVLAVLLVGMGVGVAVALHWALRFQSWGVFSAFWQQNTAYTSAEFVALHTATAAGFLLTKPILLLGTLALLVRGSIQRVAAIRVTALLQALLLLLFLVSAGYDRFGLWLAPLACVFFAEWVVAVWRRIDVPWQRHRRMKLVTWASVILLLAWQRTLWLPRWWPEPNLAERQMALQLANATEPIGTLELALVPFLSSNAHVLLPAITPAAARQQPTALQLPPSARFIAGPYYHTEYRPRMGARTVLCGTKPLPGSLPDSQHPYTLFQCR